MTDTPQSNGAEPPPLPLKPQSTSRYDLPSVLAEQERRSQKLLLLAVRLLFLVLLVTVTLLTVRSDLPEEFEFTTMLGLGIAAIAVGVLVLIVDAMTPNKRLGSLAGVYLGICVGLIGALAIGALLDTVADAWELNEGRSKLYLDLGKFIVGIVLCYISVSIVLTTKDNFRLVIPYVEFTKQVRGVRPLLLDTSALIDGRINDLGETGFMDAPLILPQFVVDELQTLADSSNRLKRSRGRRGLDMVSRLQANPYIDVSIDDPIVEGLSVDHMLLELARSQNLRILTSDYNLKKVAEIHGVAVLNINDLANMMKANFVPGDEVTLQVVKVGENPSQGVGYLPDGTMVVIEEAAACVGDTVRVSVTNSLQTSAGRMIFGRLANGAAEQAAQAAAATIAQAATTQPRTTDKPPARGGKPPSGRNPRR